ncbi:MAG: ComEC/Rec2 family competence protein, partial [Thermoguttaceae bacterium]|nr:ComEC/Rec2 family competence protein [Thermoguttaceae bacterium]
VPYFIAVASGILADAWFAPGFLFWASLAILAAAASCALFGRDWKRRRAAEKSALTLKEEVCANDADFKDGRESLTVERADVETSSGVETKARSEAEESAEPEPPLDADGDAAAYWADWLAANGGEAAKFASGRRVDGEESQDWNAALSRFLAERRRRGLPTVGAARFADVEKDGRSEKTNGRASGDKADETGTCVDRLRRERGVGGETDETLIFDFEGFDEFSVWRGSMFQRGERNDVGAFGGRFDDGDEEQNAQDRLNWRERGSWRNWAAKRRGVAARTLKRFGVCALDWARAVPWRTVWAAVAIAALAGWRHDAHFNVFAEREIAFFVPADGGTPATLELKLTNTPQLYKRSEAASPMFGGGESTVFEGRVRRAKNGGVWEEFDGRVSVSVDGDATFLRVGDSIRVSGKLTRPAKVGNPGEIDRRYILRSRRILTRLAVGSPDDVEILTENEPFSAALWGAQALESVRLRAARTLNEHLSPRNAAVASGMTFGFRNDIDDETNEAFRATGTIHLLSISGLHVSLVAAAFCLLLRLAGVSARLISVATFAFVLFYLGLTDMRTPVLRATLLIAILCGGVVLRRRVVSLNALTTAAIALLFWNPCELFQLGAQLSFLATGVFLWSTRGNIRDKGAAASARLAAIRERRRALGTSAKAESGGMEEEREERGEKREKGERKEREETLNGASCGKRANGEEGNENAERESDADFAGAERKKRRIRTLRATARRVGRSICGKFWALTKVGAAIWAVGTPLILSATNMLTPVAILANPVVWAPATLALWAALALAAFGTLRSFGVDLAAATGCGFGLDALGSFGVAALAGATDRIFDAFLGTLDALRAAPFGTFRTPGPPTWALWAFYLPLIFWTLFPKFRPTRRTAARALALWLAALLVADVVAERRIAARDATRVEIFSIGHGISILAFFPDGRTALFDCGSVSNSERAAEIAARALWDAGRTRIDLAVASHADYDHYGGLRTLAETVEIGRVCVSPAMFNKRDAELDALRDALERKNIPIETVVGGETFARFGFPELAALHPTLENGPLGDESNENSLVVALERNGRRILLPGDLDAPGALFLRTPPTRFDLILAPHHGGKSENYRDLLDWADPTWVVVSGGSFQRNRATEDALRAEGRGVLHTLDDGCVTVEIDRDPT